MKITINDIETRDLNTIREYLTEAGFKEDKNLRDPGSFFIYPTGQFVTYDFLVAAAATELLANGADR